MEFSPRPFDPTKLPAPKGWEHGFAWPSAAEVDIEIGCGVGLHPIKRVQAHPERHLIAIEQTKAKFEGFAGRIKTHGSPQNLTGVHADATNWISHFVPEESVSTYFLLYPNPYPKKRLQNLRWAQRPFMGYLIKTLKPGGNLVFASNKQDYFEESRDLLTKVWGLEILESGELDPKMAPRTHFEKKYLARGEKCFNLRLKKPES